MYKLQQNSSMVQRLSDGAFIPFAESNTDYATFKRALMANQNADGSEFVLQDADGNVMLWEDTGPFICSLP